jgi:hypothetical protein
VSNSNTNPHLTIKTITTANAGDYICRATNVVATSSSTQSRLVTETDNAPKKIVNRWLT